MESRHIDWEESEQVNWQWVISMMIGLPLSAYLLIKFVVPLFNRGASLWVISLAVMLMFGTVFVIVAGLGKWVAIRYDLPPMFTEINYGEGFRTATQLLVAGLAGAFATTLADISNPVSLSLLVTGTVSGLWIVVTFLQWTEYQFDRSR